MLSYDGVGETISGPIPPASTALPKSLNTKVAACRANVAPLRHAKLIYFEEDSINVFNPDAELQPMASYPQEGTSLTGVR
jgi:hypothetical protein